MTGLAESEKCHVFETVRESVVSEKAENSAKCAGCLISQEIVASNGYRYNPETDNVLEIELNYILD